MFSLPGSRRPSILPVPDMVTSNLNIASDNQDEEVEADESEDELEDDVPWRSPSEKIAYAYIIINRHNLHPHARKINLNKITI